MDGRGGIQISGGRAVGTAESVALLNRTAKYGGVEGPVVDETAPRNARLLDPFDNALEPKLGAELASLLGTLATNCFPPEIATAKTQLS